MNKYFNLHTLISTSNVKVAAAATALHDILAYSLCVLGEGVLTTKPYYGRFEIDSGKKVGVRLVAANTDHKTCFDEGVVGVLTAKLRESEEEGIEIRAVFDC
jgi:1-aminocyclopropane-1-carboxylate synthase